jgi:L-iditol 2-dehydrogenase
MSLDLMHAAVLHGPGDLRYEEVPVPQIGPGEALVRVRACGVCGSDLPRVLDAGGAYFYPLIPGHEFAGELVALGDPDAPVALGTQVAVIPIIPCGTCEACRQGLAFHCPTYGYLGSRSPGGFAEYVAVPVANLVPLPPGLDVVHGAFAEPLAVGAHVLRRAGLAAGDTVAVWGFGAIGNLIAQLALQLGAASVIGVDVDARKLDLARATGLTSLVNGQEQDPVQEIRAQTEGRGVDVAVEASGSVVALQQALQATRRLGHLGLVGRAERDVTVPWPLFVQILRQELTLVGVWGFDGRDSWERVLGLLGEGRVRVQRLITHTLPLAEAGAIIPAIRAQSEFFGKVILIP